MKDKIKTIFTRIKENLIEEIYPSNITCFNCDAELVKPNKYHLCNVCLDKINIIKNCCKKCGEELNDFTNYCLNCKDAKRNFDKIYSVATFDGVAKNIIYKFKYGKSEYMADCITPFLLEKLSEVNLKEIDLIMAVPLSQERLKERGFNQAKILSDKLSKELGIKSVNLLRRIKNTSTQTALTKLERKQNLLNAFIVEDKQKIKNKNILVIDDIITTGATFDEVAKVLKTKGANKVFGLTFCHTKNNKV